MTTLRDDAVVLRAYKSGESDRVVVLWTRNHGKIRCIARGVRKGTSKLGSGLEPLSYVDVLWAKGRGELQTISQVVHRMRFPTVRGDLDRLTNALVLLEIVDAIPTDDVPDEAVFVMLTKALASLDDERFQPHLVPAGFILKLLALDGSAPQLEACVECASTTNIVAFDAEHGGVLCVNCRSGRPLSPDAWTLLRRLALGDLGSVLQERAPRGGDQVVELTRDAIERHFGRRLKSLRVGDDVAPRPREQR